MIRAALTPLFVPFFHRSRVAILLLLAASGTLADGGFSGLQAQTGSRGAETSSVVTSQGKKMVAPRVAFAQTALAFEPNLGQDPSRAPFIAYGRGYELRLEPGQASVVFPRPRRSMLDANAAESIIGLQLLAANPLAVMHAEEKAQGGHSYFPGRDRASWITNVPQYGRVTYQGVYPGVDLSFYGKAGRLEYDFILQPNADSSRLQLIPRNAVHCGIDAQGDLQLRSRDAAISLLKPLAYQLSPDGLKRVPVHVRYRIRRVGEGRSSYQIGFSIGAYDHDRKLIIDPVVLYGLDIPGTPGFSYPPYYWADTNITAMTADSAGNTYVAASVGSSYASTNILKYDPTGNLLFNASLGSSSSYIDPRAIAVDASGDVYLAGAAGSGLPTTDNALEPVPPSGGAGGFIAVIKADGSALTYSSYLGDSSEDTATGLAVDPAGEAYVTGYTNSPNFPTTAGAYLTVFPGEGYYSGFVIKLNPALAGNAGLVYSTFLSGIGTSQGEGIAIDGAGDAFVISSAAPGFPVTPGAYNFDGPSETGAYLSKVNPAGTDLIYSAYLGPGNPAGIAVDASGSAYVTGTATSSNFPVTSGAYQTSYPGGFVLKMNSAGTGLVYSTYLSGPSGYAMSNVEPAQVAIAPGCATSCAAYVAGSTTTTDFPLLNPIQSFPGSYGLEPSSQEGGVVSNGFLVEIAGAGKTSTFSTYFGGASSWSYGTAIAVDAGGNIYFAANVEGSDAPVTLPAVQDPGYGFLAKISPASAGAAVAVPAHVVFAGSQPVNATITSGGTVELRNMGSAAITLTRPFAISSTEFAETDNCPVSFPGGGICTLSVSFTPAASGQRSGTLSISSSGRNSPTVVALSGTAIDAPDLQISATTLTFADQVVTTASAAQVVTLTNSGDEPQPITAILTGGISDFKATSNCPAQLAAGSECQVSVVFSPSQIGLLGDYLYIEIPGGYDYVNLEGSGVAAAAGTGTVQFSPTSLSFGSIVLGQSAAYQEVILMNTGSAPVTVNALSITPASGEGNSGDFSLVAPAYGNLCRSAYAVGSDQPYAPPFAIEPQGSCVIYVTFQPSIAGQEAATLTMSDSAVGSPQTLGLSGIGLSSEQPLIITPSTATFPAQPVRDPSATQTFTITNPGEDYVAIDRVFTTGDFGTEAGSNCSGATLAPEGTCSVSVLFDPATTGARTGTLTLTDSISGTPSVFNLAGTGIAATGALKLGQSSLTFGTQDAGTTSESVELLVSNPGNSPVTINSVESTPQFAVTSQPNYYNNPASCGGPVSPGGTCAIDVAFSPTQSSGAVSGSLSIHSTAGTMTVALSGTATESAQAIHITPTTINFGASLIGGTTTNFFNNGAVTVYIDNTGGAPVTFSTAPTIAGVAPAPGTDFQFRDTSCYQYLPLYPNSTPVPMPPGGSCSFTLTFVPSLSGTEKATVALTDSAGKQTIALSGAGQTSNPAITLDPPVLTFDHLAVSASTPTTYQNEIVIYNSGSQPVTISSVAVSAGSTDFSEAANYSYCTGYTLNPGGACDLAFVFHPSAVGYRTGTATFIDSAGNKYTAALAGYGVAAVAGAQISPQVLVMPPAPVQPAIGASNSQAVTLNNTGNMPLTIGTITGTNAATGDDFPSVTSGCNGATVQPGSSCTVGVSFQPLATGQRTGSLTFPVTYSDQTTTTLTADLSGLGQAAAGSATLSPSSATFPVTVAGTNQANEQSSTSFVLTNTGNVQLTIGTMTGTDLTATAGTGGDFYIPSNWCANDVLNPGNSCTIPVDFEPLTTGLKSGAITIPVTYSGGAKATFTSTFTGQGVAPAPAAQVTPSGLAFNPEVAGTIDTTNEQTVIVTSTGNVNLAIKSITASQNFTIMMNTCYSGLQNGSFCTVTVGFTPLASTAAGTVTGNVTIVDNAPNSPQIVQLSGKAISASQELSLSQATVTFANQKAGTASPAQVVYLTDLGAASNSNSPSQVQINSIVLGGTDASDFTETQVCGGNLGFTMRGRTDCEISIAFAPGANSFGARTAAVTITPAKGAAMVITLKGNAYGPAAALAAPKPGTVLAGPDVTFSWGSEAGATGYALHLGTAAGGANLYSSGEITATSAEPTDLPTTGGAVYATLITYYGAVAVSNSYKFTEAAAAALTTPTAGGTLGSPNQTFRWTSGVGATSYFLELGSHGPGSSDLYFSGNSTSTSIAVLGLPASGGTVYVRLTTNFHGASVSRDYTFAAAPPPPRTMPVKLHVSPASN